MSNAKDIDNQNDDEDGDGDAMIKMIFRIVIKAIVIIIGIVYTYYKSIT